jgi:hypothetical protein
MVVLAYNTGFGVGATHDFAPDFSFLGFSFDWRASLTDNIWAGLSIDWQVLYSKQDMTETFRNVTVSGEVVTHLNLFPMLATGHYYFMTDPRGVRPYGGIGVGAYSAERRLDVGFWTLADTSWHFGFAPELGIALPTGASSVVVATKFNYAFPSDGWDEIMYFNFNVGVEL